MAMGNAYDQYRQQQIASTPSDKILLMLYDGAIRFCEKAKVAIQEKDVQEANNFIIKVERILEELRSCLDMSYDISHNLYSLYDYMYSRLMEANLKKEIPMIDEVAGMLAELRETWSQAIIEAKKVQEDLKTEDSYQSSSSVEEQISAGINQDNSVLTDIKPEPEPMGLKTAAAKAEEAAAMMSSAPQAAPGVHLAQNHMASYYNAMTQPITLEDAAGAAKVSITAKPSVPAQSGASGQIPASSPFIRKVAGQEAKTVGAQGQSAPEETPPAKPVPGFLKNKPQIPLTPGNMNFEG
jgi:flagellar protein FliS